MQLCPVDAADGFHAQLEGEAGQGALLLIRGHVGHERQILHQPAALPLWRVCWAQHAPLTGLQRSGTTHLQCLTRPSRTGDQP